jgi:replicative DNA helicase
MSYVPTYSLEAEQSVLGCLLRDNAAFDAVGDILSPESFSGHGHAAIWSVIAGLIVASKPADVLTVFEVLRERGADESAGGLPYLGQLEAGVLSARNVRRHAEVVAEKHAGRKLVAAAGDAYEIAREDGEVSGRVDRITSLFSDLALPQQGSKPRHISDIAIARIDHYNDLADGKIVPGWRTHIPTLTAMLNGGFRPGALYILAARPSVGKSSFSQDLGLNFADDQLPTLFLSQEMSAAEVADRGVSNSGRLSYSALLTGRMEREDWKRASDAMEALGRRPFYVDDQPSLTLQQIRMKAKAVKGLRVLVLDYLQLCASTRKDSNRNAEIEEISRGLKTLAKELGIAVLALSQLNRDVEKRANKRPTLSDLRDSGAIEQDADVVMFLWPVREFPNEGRRILGLGIDKNRNGRLGEVALDFFGDVQRWGESTADIRPEQPAKRNGGFE